jgi:hypothetical protein
MSNIYDKFDKDRLDDGRIKPKEEPNKKDKYEQYEKEASKDVRR